MSARLSAPPIHVSRWRPGTAVIALALSLLAAANALAVPPGASPLASPAVGTRTAGTHGIWEPLPPPLTDQCAAVYDPLLQRMLVFGGQDESRMVRGDLWGLSLTGSPEWSLVAPTGSSPGPRLGHVLVLDPKRNRLLLFGGYGSADSMTLNDVWALALGQLPFQWIQLAPAGAPPSRRLFASAVYDSANDRLVMFGGADSLVIDGAPSGFRNDVWALSLAGTPTWSQLVPTGTPPTPRAGSAMIYDLARQRAVLFDGFDGSVTNDGFTLSLGASPAWAPLGATGGPPPGRVLGGVAYDAPDDRVVYFGGLVDPSSNLFLGDVWSLALGSPAWTQLSPSGTAPSARGFMSSIYETEHDRMVIFGGQDTNDLVTDPAWTLSLGATPAWTDLGLGRPTPRDGQAAGYDPTNHVMVIEGGRDRNGNLLGDAWSVTLGSSPQWTRLAPTGTPLGKRIGHSCIYDPVRSRYLFFGGSDTLSIKNDVWSLTLGGTPAWTQLSPAGTPPSARLYQTAIYDSLGDRMVVFGGQEAGFQKKNDVWALSLSGTPTWTQLSPTGVAPLPRHSHSAAIERAGYRMIVFGGLTDFDADNGVYALTLGGSPAWSAISPAGTPPVPRMAAAMVSTGTHMVVYGGQPFGSNVVYDDAWFLTLYPSPVWLPLDLGPTLPGGRKGASVAFDDATFAMYAFGGRGFTDPMNDLWLLQLDETTPVEAALVGAHAEPDRVELSWQLGSAATRATVYRRTAGGDWAAIATGIADGTGRLSFVDRDVIAGARYGYRLGIAADAGTSFAGEVWIDVPAAPRFALAGLAPNPAASRAALVSFTLPDASAARLELLDLGGRRVFAREVGSLGAGTHLLRVGDALPAGLYFVRLTRGARVLTAKATILE